MTDDGGKSQQQTGDGDKKNKEVFGRFAKRNYRRRTESQSSTCSVPMEEDPTPEQNNDDNGTNSNQNNPEVSELKSGILLILLESIKPKNAKSIYRNHRTYFRISVLMIYSCWAKMKVHSAANKMTVPKMRSLRIRMIPKIRPTMNRKHKPF